MCKFYIKPFLTNKSKVFKVVLKTEVIMNKKGAVKKRPTKRPINLASANLSVFF